MIQIKLDGNWMGVGVELNRLPLSVMSAAVWGQRKIAESLVKKVKKHINAQDMSWPQRASGYQAGDPRILVNEEDYYNAIKAWKDGNTYHAGVKNDAFNRDGMRIADYANMNEYGGGNLPPRPLWGPSIQELGGNAGIKAVVVGAIFSKVTRLRAVGMDVKLGNIL